MRPLAILAAVAALDIITKMMLHTPPELEHDRGRSWVAVALAVAIVTWAWGHRFGIYLPTGLIAAGCFANAIDMLDGTASNPMLVVTSENHYLGFNVADVAIVAGCVLLAARILTTAIRHLEVRA